MSSRRTAAGGQALRVVVAGGTGLVGSALVASLRARGDEVLVLTRGPERDEGDLTWDSRRGVRPARRLEGFDAVVNLVGEPLATRPWTPARRRRLVASRVEPTAALRESVRRLEAPPRTYVGVAAIGIHGAHGDAWIDDDDPPGEGFLAELGTAWEQAHAEAAGAIGARLAVLRMGVILAAEAGAFPALLAPFRAGLGGWAGDGTAYTPFVSLRDAVGALTLLLDREDATGAFHGTVPEPPRNRELCVALGAALGRPIKGHAPAWVLRGALGELADAFFLGSVRARPRRLTELGYVFQDPEIGPLMARLVAEHR